MKPEGPIKEEVIEVLRTDATQSGRIDLRLVRWNDGDLVLEKRWIYKKPAGTYQTGRCTGFTIMDLKFLKRHLERIIGVIERGEEPAKKP